MENLGKAELLKMKKEIEKLLVSDVPKDDLKINVFIRKNNKMEGNRWLFLYQDTEFLLSKALSPIGCKVIMLFRAVCKYENKVDYSAAQITKILDVSRQSVYRAIKELKDIGIILEFKDDYDERKKVYYLNPESQWKGKVAKMSGLKAIFSESGKFEDFRTSIDSAQVDLIEQIASLDK